MADFRRGQVEWALWRLKAGDETRRAPPSQFLARIKRVLDMDRTATEGPKPRGAAPFAFSALPPGGRGENAAFSKLDALMLWLALELLELGFKQQEVVAPLRQARPMLERALKDLLETPPLRPTPSSGKRFNFEGPADPALARFLVLPRVEDAALWTRTTQTGREPMGPLLLKPDEVAKLLSTAPQTKLVIIPAGQPAYRVNLLLERAPDIQDGRRRVTKD
jgi:hypothetical protein